MFRDEQSDCRTSRTHVSNPSFPFLDPARSHVYFEVSVHEQLYTVRSIGAVCADEGCLHTVGQERK